MDTSGPPLLPGELVEVKAWPEIQRTLDAQGCHGGLPFMPEMARLCGRRYRVWRRIEKTCVEGDRVRRMQNTVLLEGVRCDGSAHGGCEKDCTLFWRERWLKRVLSATPAQGSVASAEGDSAPVEPFPYPTRSDPGRYFCQSTELRSATCVLSKADLRQYYRDLRMRTWSLPQMARFAAVALALRLKAVFCGLATVKLRGRQTRTPTAALGLQPGEWVEVKSPREIAATLDTHGRNRGLEFPVYMLPFCGRRYRVQKRVNRIILETSAVMREIHDTVILEGVTCDGYGRWGGCPRDAHHLWREVWLRRA